MYNYTIQYLKLLYRITIISSTLSLLNKEKLLTMRFILNVMSTSGVFLITMIINDKLKEPYKNVEKVVGFNIMPILVSPLIISILYILRHSCLDFVCKK